MLTLITGAPGSSKTSHVLSLLMNEKERPIYHRGIKGLALDWVELSDDEARDWPETIPDGAILVVDEVQDIWPQRPLSRPTPIGCSEMSKHRHRGIDIYLITQHPTGVDHEARKYVNEHIHLVRNFGAPFVTRYHSGSGVIDIKDQRQLNKCNKETVKLPKKTWGLYKSAEVHTHKFRLPKKVLLIIPLLAGMGYCIYFFLGWLDDTGDTDQPDPTPIYQESVRSQPDAQPQRVKAQETDWGHLLSAEVPGLPYTAPMYHKQATNPQSVPVVHGCMSFREDMQDCTCHTQQGTRIHNMPLDVCIRTLEYGMFNHLAKKEKKSDRPENKKAREAGSGLPRRPRADPLQL